MKLTPQFTLTKDQMHNKFSRTIPPVLTVPSGSVIEAFTEEASDEQFSIDSDVTALETLSFDPIHPLTGPVYVEGALFSIGDTHAAQGMGEVCGTAIEAPMRIVYEIEVLKGGPSITSIQAENYSDQIPTNRAIERIQ